MKRSLGSVSLPTYISSRFGCHSNFGINQIDEVDCVFNDDVSLKIGRDITRGVVGIWITIFCDKMWNLFHSKHQILFVYIDEFGKLDYL